MDNSNQKHKAEERACRWSTNTQGGTAAELCCLGSSCQQGTEQPENCQMDNSSQNHKAEERCCHWSTSTQKGTPAALCYLGSKSQQSKTLAV